MHLQVRLVDALTVSDEEAPGAHLFTVGDPKQSIYRFRGADLEQFRSVRSRGGAEVTHLTTNFRTVASVVDWVNRAFEPLLTDTAGEWTALDVSREFSLANTVGGVQMLGGPLEDLKARDVRELEAADTVARLVAAKQEGWLVEVDGELRPIRYGDMATLMPTRRSLPALERELRRAQVPYRVESRSLIWATQEIRDLTNVLTAVANPRDEVAVLATLRSAAFACGDDDLYQWTLAKHGWNYTVALSDEAQQMPVGRALGRIKALHDRHVWVPVSQFVAEVVAELRMYELAFARPRQREAWHRLRFAVDRARAWTEEGGSGLHGFVQWIQTQDREAADAIETVVPEADDDAVRLMTIHASKGLEFPLVALVGLGSPDTVTDSARLIWTKSGCEVRIGDKDIAWQTAGFAESCVRRRESWSKPRRLRLLYVGATRARDHLLVSLYRQAKRGSNSLAACIEGVVQVTPEPLVARQLISENSSAKVQQDVEAPHLIRERRKRLVKFASRPLAMSATAVASRASGTASVLPTVTASSATSDAAQLAERLDFGSAVHKALEVIDLQASSELVAEVAQQQAAEFGLLGRELEVARSVSKALTSPLLRQAINSGRWWREVPVYCSENDLVVGGTIDLLFENPDGLVVVDYKTEDTVDGDSLDRAVERYKWQLVTYVLAVERSLGKKVSEAVLLFIPPTAEPALAAPLSSIDEAISILNSDLFGSWAKEA